VLSDVVVFFKSTRFYFGITSACTRSKILIRC